MTILSTAVVPEVPVQTTSQVRTLTDVRSDILRKRKDTQSINDGYYGYLSRMTTGDAVLIFKEAKAMLAELEYEYCLLGGKPEDLE